MPQHGKRRFWYALSLGPDCQTKFHLVRRYPAKFTPSSVFDWQHTPASALIAYLERDFSGTFEREDLAIGPGSVINTRFGTSHLHAFPGGVDEAGLDAAYEEARARHEYLCEKTRRLLRLPLPLLLVLGKQREDGHLAEVRELLQRKYRRFSSDLLPVAITDAPPTDPEQVWEGNHEHWEGALQDQVIGLGRVRDFIDGALPKLPVPSGWWRRASG